MSKYKFITIEKSEARDGKQMLDKVKEFVNSSDKTNIKLRAYNPYMHADRPMTIAAWEDGVLIVKDPNRTYYYYNMIWAIEDLAVKVIDRKDIHRVEGSVTRKKINMGAFLSTFKT